MWNVYPRKHDNRLMHVFFLTPSFNHTSNTLSKKYSWYLHHFTNCNRLLPQYSYVIVCCWLVQPNKDVEQLINKSNDAVSFVECYRGFQPPLVVSCHGSWRRNDSQLLYPQGSSHLTPPLVHPSLHSSSKHICFVFSSTSTSSRSCLQARKRQTSWLEK